MSGVPTLPRRREMATVTSGTWTGPRLVAEWGKASECNPGSEGCLRGTRGHSAKDGSRKLASPPLSPQSPTLPADRYPRVET